MSDSNIKIPLPKYLKILTSNGVPVTKAMAIAGKIYKEHNTETKLAELTEVKLSAAGISEKEDRKLVLAAIRKEGYIHTRRSLKKEEAIEKKNLTDSMLQSQDTGPSTQVYPTHSPTKRKRKQSSNKNEYLADEPEDEEGNFDFKEVLDEDILRTKCTVINRAPMMMAWSMLVAECLGFKKEEALSIASVYTEMNAISKGVSLGIFAKGKGKGIEASETGSQPYVDLMGRKPLYQLQEGQWRALSNGTPVSPGAAFSYINRSFRQTTPYIIGALRLLAMSYTPKALNNKGWALYADFRPEVDGWGKRSEVRCETILNLRLQCETSASKSVREGKFRPPVEMQEQAGVDPSPDEKNDADEPRVKKARTMSLEEYEEALDNDTTFNDVNLDYFNKG